MRRGERRCGKEEEDWEEEREREIYRESRNRVCEKEEEGRMGKLRRQRGIRPVDG